MYIDVHAHLYEPYFEDIDEVIKRAEEAQVTTIIINGLNKTTNRRVLELAKKHKIVKAALGIYPTEAVPKDQLKHEIPQDSFNINEELKFIEKNKDNIIALGEVGLDNKEITKKETQTEVFTRIIKLGKKLNKPLIIHSRKAEEELINLLEQEKAKKVIMHCFSGKKKLVQRVADNGWSCSIPTCVTRSEQFQNIINTLPIKQLFAETDAPYLSPFKDTRNEPAYIVESYKMIAKIKKLTLEETKNLIFQNYQKLFL